MTDDLDLEAMDSGDAAMLGLIAGAGAGYVLSDGNAVAATLGAGAGLVASGESFERILNEFDPADER